MVAAGDAAVLLGVARGLVNVPGVREGRGVHPVVRRLVGELAGMGGERLQGLLLGGGSRRGGRPAAGSGAWWE